MISVLIPTYNYNVYPLVREVDKQLHKTGVNYEIRVYDDASTVKFDANELLKEIPSVSYKTMPENQGRLALRYRLAQDAKYNFVLFMDADVFPKDRFFISKLLKAIEKNDADVFFGGITVPPNPLRPNQSLRWKYGKERESVPVEERLKNPYKTIICGSITLKKSVFLQEAKDMLPIRKYGLDVLFSYKLKIHNRKVHHFNNPVTHLGLETNQEFINKTHEALQTFRYLVNKDLLDPNYTKITKFGEKFSKLFPAFFFDFSYKIFSPLLLKNLLSKNPSLLLFDIYKLLYYSRLK